MNNNFDDFLKSKFKESDNITPFNHQIDEIIGKIFIKRRKRKKLLLMALPVILISTTALAISYSIFNLSSVGIDDSCLQVAIQNGYIQTLDMQGQEFNGLEIKINKFLIDDINMDISFEYKINGYNIDTIKDIYIQDLYIYDENNTLLYSEKEKNNENSASQTIGYSKVEKLENGFKNTFFAQSDEFPQSKKINIEFSNIIINSKNKNLEINGNWKFEIDVLPNMVYRDNINYKPISNSNNNEDVIIKNIKMTNTGLIVNAEATNNKILDNTKITILTENKKIKPNSNIFEKNPTEKNNRTEYIFTYNLTKYDAPEKIIVRIKTRNKERDIVFIKDDK